MNKQEELIDKIIKDAGVVRTSPNGEYIISSLRKNLPTLNPMRIDEERMKQIHTSFCVGGYDGSYTNKCVSKYNSTLEDHHVLQPLPSEMPDEFEDNYYVTTSDYTWKWIVLNFGTPTKKELVSVEELRKELVSIYQKGNPSKGFLHHLAQHIVNKYGLNPPKRDEFPFNLKIGDIVKCDDGVYGFDSHYLLLRKDVGQYLSVPLSQCTPYIEPTILERLKAKGVTDDEINELINQHEKQEFMKEVNNG